MVFSPQPPSRPAFQTWVLRGSPGREQSGTQRGSCLLPLLNILEQCPLSLPVGWDWCKGSPSWRPLVLFRSSAHMLPPSGPFSFSTLYKMEEILWTVQYCPVSLFYFSPRLKSSPLLTSFFTAHTQKASLFFTPGSENLEMKSWHRIF